MFETFGSIHSPMYSIRFASAAAIDRDVVEKGKDVFYLPAQSTYVLTQLLRSMKGSDASNIWDEEVAKTRSTIRTMNRKRKPSAAPRRFDLARSMIKVTRSLQRPLVATSVKVRCGSAFSEQ